MSSLTTTQPRLHNEVYDAIHPSKFIGALESRVVVITGAGGTIGESLCECFARASAILCLLDYNTSGLQDIKTKCLSLGAEKVFTFQCDVSSYEACDKTVAEIIKSTGQVDVLINNAGVSGLRAFHNQNPQKFIHDLAINLHGPFFLMRLILPSMRERKAGCIINVASRAGTCDMPLNISYSTSKAGLIRLTSCLQMELDIAGLKDIHLYSLHPGAVRTKMVQDQKPDPSLFEFPEFLKSISQWVSSFKTSPDLMSMTAVALSTGIAKDVLRGRYIDCEQDISDVLAQKDSILQDPLLNTLSIQFLGALPNDGGMEKRQPEPEFIFED